MNNTKFSSSFTIIRECDANNKIATKMEYIQGMPDVLVITQGAQRIELTSSETKIFHYVMREFRNYVNVVKQAEDDSDD